MSPLYQITTKHDETSIRRLSAVQYDTFYKKVKLGYYAACFALILFGMLIGGTAAIACLLLACFMITGVNNPAKRNADKVIKSMKGNYPETEYNFFSDELRFGSPGEKFDDMGIVAYSRFEKFIEDPDFLFLFVTKYGAYVIPKKLLSDNDIAGIKRVIENSCGKTFEKPGSMFNMKFSDLK